MRVQSVGREIGRKSPPQKKKNDQKLPKVHTLGTKISFACQKGLARSLHARYTSLHPRVPMPSCATGCWVRGETRTRTSLDECGMVLLLTVRGDSLVDIIKQFGPNKIQPIVSPKLPVGGHVIVRLCAMSRGVGGRSPPPPPTGSLTGSTTGRCGRPVFCVCERGVILE
jgi:hypothetical protein